MMISSWDETVSGGLDDVAGAQDIKDTVDDTAVVDVDVNAVDNLGNGAVVMLLLLWVMIPIIQKLLLLVGTL